VRTSGLDRISEVRRGSGQESGGLVDVVDVAVDGGQSDAEFDGETGVGVAAARTGQDQQDLVAGTVAPLLLLIRRPMRGQLSDEEPEVPLGRFDGGWADSTRSSCAANTAKLERVHCRLLVACHSPNRALTTRLPVLIPWSAVFPSFGDPAGGTQNMGNISSRAVGTRRHLPGVSANRPAV
jgi:hypothetical protein